MNPLSTPTELTAAEFNVRQRRIRAYAQELFRAHQVPEIPVRFHPPGSHSFYHQPRQEIHLSLQHDFKINLYVFAHEFRHYLQDQRQFKFRVQQMKRRRLIQFCAATVGLLGAVPAFSVATQTTGVGQIFSMSLGGGCLAAFGYCFADIFLRLNSPYCRLYRILEKDADRFANQATGLGLYFHQSGSDFLERAPTTHPSEFHRHQQALKYPVNLTLKKYWE